MKGWVSEASKDLWVGKDGGLTGRYPDSTVLVRGLKEGCWGRVSAF